MLAVTFDGYDFRVPAPDGSEAGSYYTDDKHDAVATARDMYRDPTITPRFYSVDQHPEGWGGALC